MPSATRKFEFVRKNGQWTINGHTWADVIASNFTLLEAHPGVNDVEIWEFKNTSGGWFHPVHIHLIDFKVLDRNGRPPFDYEKAPKDVVYVGENETVRMIGRFERQVGQLHDALPQPRPRGPRHDGPVRGRNGRPRPDHDRSRPQRPGAGGLGYGEPELADGRAIPGARPAPGSAASLAAGTFGLVAVLSGVAAGIHLGVAPEHFGEWWGYGAFFVLAAAGECGLVALLALRPRAWVVQVGIGASLVTMLMYLVSRTSGIPFGPSTGVVEPVDLLGLAATAARAPSSSCSAGCSSDAGGRAR